MKRVDEITSDAYERRSQDSDVISMARGRPRAICLTAVIRRQPRYPQIWTWAGGFASLPCDSFAKRHFLPGAPRTRTAQQNRCPCSL